MHGLVKKDNRTKCRERRLKLKNLKLNGTVKLSHMGDGSVGHL